MKTGLIMIRAYVDFYMQNSPGDHQIPSPTLPVHQELELWLDLAMMH